MANRYWVGGSGTWDASDQSHWSSVTGPTGDAPQSVPTSVDDVIFNANSGGGTVTVNGDHTVKSLDISNHSGGTMDWSVNNNNFTSTGSANLWSDFSGLSRTIKLGAGTFQFDTLSFFNGTGVTWQPGTALVKFVNAGTFTTSLAVALASLFPFPSMTIGPDVSWPVHGFSQSPTITNLDLIGSVKVHSTVGVTVTTLTCSGYSKGKGAVLRSEGGTIAFALTNPATLHWACLRQINCTSAAIRAYNSMDFGGCTNVIFSPPKYGRIIGG
jgi:hypothetical protein